MKKFLFLVFYILISFFAEAQISGVINSYARVSSKIGSVLTIENISLAPSTSMTDVFGAGKKVLIIQMKGASINTTNTASFGEITNLNNAGNYEFTEAVALVGVGPIYTLTLQSLVRDYDVIGDIQIVSVPQFTDVTVSGTLTAIPWNSTLKRGGILTMQVSNVLTMSGNANVNGLGFSGGQPNSTNQASCNNSTTYVSPALDIIASRNQRHAEKGESIADYTFNGITGQNFARGAIANGGGGGNSHNGGGGGGSNLGIGGNGGFGWLGGGACTTLNVANGIGGRSMTYSTAANRLYLGGGGGGGQQNNSNASRGGNGGGIILIKAKEIRTATTTPIYGFYTNGETAPNSTGNDGGGGGGGGGAIVMEVDTYNLASVIIVRTNGGKGGDAVDGTQHGGGGGGGIGAILTNNMPPALADFNSTPGVLGTDCTTCTNTGTLGGNNGGNTVISGWSSTGLTSSLPIVLVSFDAIAIQDAVEVRWKTLSEINTDYFIIERTQDFNTITNLQQIDIEGNSYDLKNYLYLDENPLRGISYYRLKSVDNDGSIQYSQWADVSFYAEIIYNVYPNPTSEVLHLKIISEGLTESTITLLDMTGRKIFSERTRMGLDYDIKHLPKGLYLLNIQSVGQQKVIKVLFE